MGFLNLLFGKKNEEGMTNYIEHNSRVSKVQYDLSIVAKQVEMISSKIDEIKEDVIKNWDNEKRSFVVINFSNEERLKNLENLEEISKKIATAKELMKKKGDIHSEQYLFYSDLTREISILLEKKKAINNSLQKEGEITALNQLSERKLVKKLQQFENYLNALNLIVNKSFRNSEEETEFRNTEKNIVEVVIKFNKEIKEYREKIDLNIELTENLINNGKGEAKNQIQEIIKVMKKYKHLIPLGNNTKLMKELITSLHTDFMSDVKRAMWQHINEEIKQTYDDDKRNELKRMFATINSIKLAYVNLLNARTYRYDQEMKRNNPELHNFLKKDFGN